LTLADRAGLVEAGSSLTGVATLLAGMGAGDGDVRAAVSTVLTVAGAGEADAVSDTGSKLVMAILPAFSHFSLQEYSQDRVSCFDKVRLCLTATPNV
jgi:hypothetical protein